MVCASFPASLYFCLFSLLLCFHVSSAGARCPELCWCSEDDADSNVTVLGTGAVFWNCSGLSTARQLWQFSDGVTLVPENAKWAEYPVQSVEHLYLEDSVIDFPEEFVSLFPLLKSVEFSNCSVHCSKLSSWMLAWRGKIEDFDKLVCSTPQIFFNVPFLKALHLIRELDSQCTPHCTCNLDSVSYTNRPAIFYVNCSYRGFTELPDDLPSSTQLIQIHLNLSNNQVSFKYFQVKSMISN